MNTGEWFYADYDSITIASKVDKYRWHFGTYSGTAGDALRYDTGLHYLEDMQFSTGDSDNDKSLLNCASIFNSPWWLNWCFEASLTGNYGSIDYQWLYTGQPAGFGANDN